jgi:hypothetical protein
VESSLPQVAPGLRLPENSGLFLLDNFQGQPQLVELQQDEGGINRNTRANILRGALNPVASAKVTIELEGEHATVFAHVAVPSIYIKQDDAAESSPYSKNSTHDGETTSANPSQPSLDAPRAEAQRAEQPQQPEQAAVPFDRYLVVHAKIKNGKRIVGDIRRAPTGKTSEEQSSVKTTITPVSGGWLKLSPAEDLAPGEYAIVETKGRAGMNLYVWPFSVNPKAPANANPWKPEEKSAETSPAREKDKE